ncbi:MIP/aquaporin family protein [Nocardioides ferulae]|uniref:MIP/aquaporin family protein n=1 Tax=Nocardioides ferulae TaxID=2340821 RepID=UPI000EB5D633|nr:MIP family channel protein [Nocardioides ferulae]
MTHPATDASAAATADDDATETPAAPAPPTTLQKLAAETVGTFVLVFFGCGSVAFAAEVGGSSITTIGLTFGLAVAVMAYAFGRVSGAHFNPAVSVGAALGGRIAWIQALLYMAMQLLGAVLAGLTLWLLLHGFDGFDAEGSMGQNGFGDEYTGYAWWAAFLLEALLTAVFVTVILAVTDSRNEHPALAPLAIGLTLAAIHFVAIPATGTSVNPARSIGPALFAGTDAILQLWLFLLAPLVGAAVAGVLYPLLFGRGAEPVPGSGFVLRRATPAAVPGYGAPDQYQQQWNQQQSWDQSGGGWGGQAAPAAAPIIQDGWMWEAARQQWVPAPPEYLQPQAPHQAQQYAAPQAQQGYPAPAQDQPTSQQPAVGTDPHTPQPGDTSATQIRPPEGQ